ncbi:hypothetical protein LINPERPRIM_LOCUS30509 [Linum perenne]
MWNNAPKSVPLPPISNSRFERAAGSRVQTRTTQVHLEQSPNSASLQPVCTPRFERVVKSILQTLTTQVHVEQSPISAPLHLSNTLKVRKEMNKAVGKRNVDQRRSEM